jgi:hypothetical protein
VIQWAVAAVSVARLSSRRRMVWSSPAEPLSPVMTASSQPTASIDSLDAPPASLMMRWASGTSLSPIRFLT